MEDSELVRLVIESMPFRELTWIDYLSALLVPIIAILGTYIAFQQYRINQQRLRHETYERRLKIYKVMQSYLAEVTRDGRSNYERLMAFYSDASEAAFLFDRTVQEMIDEIYQKSVKMISNKERLYPRDGGQGIPPGEERTKVVDLDAELSKWHSDKLVSSRDFFRKKLGVNVT